MITKKNLLNHELIGLNAEVVGESLKGVIVDETKNTFTIRTESGDKIMPKEGNEFRIELEEETRVVKGSKIRQRPYERLKKKYKVNNKWEEISE